MKKIIAILAVISLFTLTGCEQLADRIKPKNVERPVTKPIEELDKEGDKDNGNNNDETEEPKTKIVLSTQLKMNNEWTIMGDYSVPLTKSGKKDRIVLGTSAKSVNGEMQWDDSQYWTLAVLTEKGAYNLFYQRFQGVVYVEVNEAYLSGLPTNIITLYAFSGTDRDIRNYTYNEEEDAFIEDQIFTTKVFSTGGINNLYSTFPEYREK